MDDGWFGLMQTPRLYFVVVFGLVVAGCQRQDPSAAGGEQPPAKHQAVARLSQLLIEDFIAQSRGRLAELFGVAQPGGGVEPQAILAGYEDFLKDRLPVQAVTPTVLDTLSASLTEPQLWVALRPFYEETATLESLKPRHRKLLGEAVSTASKKLLAPHQQELEAVLAPVLDQLAAETQRLKQQSQR